MALYPLALPPGVLANGTPYQAKGRWRAAQLIRFREGRKGPVGGWVTLPLSGATISGTCRTMLGWRVDGSNSPFLAIGTNDHFYTFTDGVVTDRTIADLSTGSTDTTVQGNLYGSGLYGSGLYGRGDPTQASEVGPGIWHLDTFGNYLIGVLTPTDGRLLVWDTATQTMQGISATAGTGVLTIASGSLVDGDQVTIGSKTYTWQTALTNVDGNVWLGANNAAALANLASAINLTGTPGTDYADFMTQHTQVRAVSDATTLTVTQLVYGSTSIATTEGITAAGITWGASTVQGGANGDAPTGNRGVVVTAERFVFALGADGDDRQIAWASQESLTDWTSTETNTAGDKILPGSGRIVCGRRGRNETLIFTETDLHSAQYIGGTLVYSFTQLGSGCGIIGPNAVAVMDGRAAWMGSDGFWIYDGYVRPAPSEVGDYVFRDFNRAQKVKSFAQVLPEQNEVWFHYCSALSTEPDRYVVWNYAENHWTPGTMSRTAGYPKGAYEYPLYITDDGVIYQHENGSDHTGETAPYLESGPVEILGGNRMLMVRRLVPDDSTSQLTGRSIAATLYTANYPNEAETAHGPYTLDSPTDLRVTTRQVRVRIDEIVADDWRDGDMRLDVVEAGGR